MLRIPCVLKGNSSSGPSVNCSISSFLSLPCQTPRKTKCNTKHRLLVLHYGKMPSVDGTNPHYEPMYREISAHIVYQYQSNHNCQRPRMKKKKKKTAQLIVPTMFPASPLHTRFRLYRERHGTKKLYCKSPVVQKP